VTADRIIGLLAGGELLMMPVEAVVPFHETYLCHDGQRTAA
jgi:hypothetical protein